MIINLLEYQLLVLDHVPHQELGTLAMALQGGTQLSGISRSLLINAIAKWIGCKPSFVHVFREVGVERSRAWCTEQSVQVSLLDSLVHVLSNLQMDDTTTANDVISLLSLLARSSTENAALLFSIGAPEHIIPRVSKPECRAASLELLRNLLVNDAAHSEEYMAKLIRELVTCGNIEDKKLVHRPAPCCSKLSVCLSGACTTSRHPEHTVGGAACADSDKSCLQRVGRISVCSAASGLAQGGVR